MSVYIPLLVAFIGALFGTYFALLKSRNERLWGDRYECLLRILELSESLKDKVLIEKSNFSASGDYGSEDELLNSVIAQGSKARFGLRQEYSKVRLLFAKKDCELLSNAIQDLDRSLSDFNSVQSENAIHHANVVWSLAESCIDEAVKLSRKKCI